MPMLFDIAPLPEIGEQQYAFPWPVVAGAVVFIGLAAFLIVRAILKKKAQKEKTEP